MVAKHKLHSGKYYAVYVAARSLVVCIIGISVTSVSDDGSVS